MEAGVLFINSRRSKCLCHSCTIQPKSDLDLVVLFVDRNIEIKLEDARTIDTERTKLYFALRLYLVFICVIRIYTPH